MKSNFEKYKEIKQIEEKYKLDDKKIVIEKTNNLTNILSFIYELISKIIKILGYIIVIILCSFGATYIINNVLNLKIGGIL